jgi:hypothetical protein
MKLNELLTVLYKEVHIIQKLNELVFKLSDEIDQAFYHFNLSLTIVKIDEKSWVIMVRVLFLFL